MMDNKVFIGVWNEVEQFSLERKLPSAANNISSETSFEHLSRVRYT